MGHPPEKDAEIAAQAAAETEAAVKPAAAKRKPAARKSKAAAARAEKSPEPKTVKFEDLTLNLPDEMPDELLFDMVESEASSGGLNEYIGCLRMLRSLVGPDQFMTIRHRIGGDAEKVLGLVEDAVGCYGLTMGESEASSGS